MNLRSYRITYFVGIIIIIFLYFSCKKTTQYSELKNNILRSGKININNSNTGNISVRKTVEDEDKFYLLNRNRTSLPTEILNKIKSLTKCTDKKTEHKTFQWGNFWLLESFVSAQRTFKCEESVTYATVATFNFLNNVLPIVMRWDGPISIALYTPGSDFYSALQSIAYLRECETSLVKELVSFHLFFEMIYFPDEIISYDKYISNHEVNCSSKPPFELYKTGESFKEKKKTLFMVNVARNIARKMSETHFILSSDIELYPSLNMVPLFLKMISQENETLLLNRRIVYAIHAFEVDEIQKPPLYKDQLRKMVEENVAESFHHKLCPWCHDFPQTEKWLEENNENMSIFSVEKRYGALKSWEPFFIGTNEDPWYDERVSWEGMRDKRIQAYVLCLLDYEFLVPNNAFLVHKPGFKKTEYFENRSQISSTMITKINQQFIPQYVKLYGDNPRCKI